MTKPIVSFKAGSFRLKIKAQKNQKQMIHQPLLQ